MNTLLKPGNNHYAFLLNLPEEEIEKIKARHDKAEQQAWKYVQFRIKRIDEDVLKEFAYRYATEKYTDENFLDSMLKISQESGNARLLEAICYVIENFCLSGCSNLGIGFARRPDAFSFELIEAAVKGDEGNLKKHFLNYARS